MRNTQQGRSMIEMLGVLAIIGVLSIGGLAGYTMAMNRHRANQILDYVSRAVVIAQTRGDGTQAITNKNCSEILDGEAVPVSGMGCTVDKTIGYNNITVSVTNINNRIAAALQNRSGNQVTITSTTNSASFTFASS